MGSIYEIDKNFKIDTKIKKDDIVFCDARKFSIYGLIYENGMYRRMPEKVARSVSDGVYYLHTNTAGGRVRFKTDSPYVAISAKMNEVGKMPHFPLSGSCGFDLYIGKDYFATFMPPFDITDGYESVIDLCGNEMREITINFPLYSNVKELYIGLSNKSTVKEPSPYIKDKPIVYYGSSITQGGCASRPGNSYEAIVTQNLSIDHINLGFSGNARAEKEMCDYICTLDMCAFVFDYDHNSPTPDYLKATHEKMFKKIREKFPKLPIILMSRPKCNLTQEEKDRLEVIKTTFKNACNNGDTCVHIIEGQELMHLCGDRGTVDGCHPNDWGFASMAESVEIVLRKALSPGDFGKM
ncbi:MAG: SGNH/GDSL hydrolase family protein [Clostridia bacterium]|nr:SGNH/GDSL hydrolase family protein [Clostridia bacterium]